MKRAITKLFSIVFILSWMGFAAAPFCAADIIYLKNGRTMEGEVRRSDEGLWIEGALFKEEEIERIEKSPAKAAPADAKPWYSGIFDKWGAAPKDVPQTQAPPAPAPRTPSAKNQQAPSLPYRQGNQAVAPPALTAPAMPAPMGLPFLAPSPAVSPAPSQGVPADFSGLIEQAQKLQDEAHRRQMMMMQEIQRVEQEGSGGPLPADTGAYQGQEAPLYDPSVYQRQDYQKEKIYKDDSYDDRQEKKSGRKFKSIEIDDYGNMSWE